MAGLSVFVVEDEDSLRVTLADDLAEAGYAVTAFADPVSAEQAAELDPPDIAVTDIRMPHMSGLELLSSLQLISPDTSVVVMTAYGSVDSAVEAMKKGAYDYITKPFKIDEMLLVLRRIAEFRSIKKDNARLRADITSKHGFETFVGKSVAVRETLDLVRTVADTATSVLITGETGTGKELLTNVLHYNSNRSKKPLVKVSCAALARDVFESELFGHEKGAFTGAEKTRAGRFEMADGGSLYLDDVDDIPLGLQVKLLRVLEEREFERVGGNETLEVDVRVIASTKADLSQLVREGRFREDLYYRLNIFPIRLAAVRERIDDIPLLIEHFCRQLCEDRQIHFRPEVLQCMAQYHWPGNVRELRNVVERLILLSREQEVELQQMPIEIIQPDTVTPELCIGQKPLDKILADIEANLIRQALRLSGGHQAKAAVSLGLPASTLRSKIEKYGLRSE
jgi:DNA-binding NtrC family response regulator